MCLALIGTVAIIGNAKAPQYSHKSGEIGESTSVPKPTSQQAYSASVNELKGYLAYLVATHGGNFALLDDVIMCESGWRTDVYSKGQVSYGISQFTLPTFQENCEGDYKDPKAQLKCMVLMFANGMAERWDCFRILN